MQSKVAFALNAATVRYEGLTALHPTSLQVASGEAVAILGPSGAGKTTLLRLLNGTARPDHGTVNVQGKDLASLSPRALRNTRGRIGFVPQDFGLVPELRVLQNVVAGRASRRNWLGSLRDLLRPDPNAVRDVYAQLERVGIPEKLYERTESLSGGQQQRVAVARALFQSPEILLADEPVASVDPARARATIQLLLALAKEHRLTLCVSLHDVEIAREFFPRLVGLREGRVLFDEAAANITDEDVRALYELESTV